MTPIPTSSEWNRMHSHGWIFCEGCHRKMLKENAVNGMCVHCNEVKRVKDRCERILPLVGGGRQSTLF